MDGASKGLLGGFAAFTLGSGLATLGYGIFLLYRHFGFGYNYGDFNLFIASIVLIAVGSVLILTLLLGVLGALKDISHLRLATLVFLFISLVILATVGVYGMVLHQTGRLQKSTTDEINNLNVNYKNISDQLKTKADALNKYYQCCGFFNEYNPSEYYDGAPDSCCADSDCTTNSSKKRYYEKACASIYFEAKGKIVFYVSVFALIAAGVVLLALILYAGLSQRAREGYAAVSRGPLK
ncbi:unnamed protein product [Adineta ricciae]|uniref:Tetraspanin n=1 Tax=Adineta ricciae TaxID=249248 RepID=A0A814F507_ADIRI|nr:unnamed protein product [Adineta ricciae]CAF0976677.1 unnamed protein product [Adineta ricciae]